MKFEEQAYFYFDHFKKGKEEGLIFFTIYTLNHFQGSDQG